MGRYYVQVEDEGASSELPGHQQPAQEQEHNDPARGHSEAVPAYRVIIIIRGLLLLHPITLLDNNHIETDEYAEDNLPDAG